MLGFTGPRFLDELQTAAVMVDLAKLDNTAVMVGCAAGLDELVRGWAVNPIVFEAEKEAPRLPMAAKLQARSQRMVRALAAAGGTLHAWPNKPCPVGVTRHKWQGSGTWGTARYAMALGVPVVWHKLGNFEMPDWAVQEQATLF